MTAVANEAATPCDNGPGMCSLLWDITGNETLSRMGGQVVSHAFNVILIVVALLVVRMIINRAINKVVMGVTNAKRRKFLSSLQMRDETRAKIIGDRRKQRADTLTRILRYANSIFIFTIMFILLLGEFGINLAPFLASAGIVGLALGFGAQNLVRDYLSGICILLEDQYGVGDWVDVGPVSGSVEDMGLRVTTLRDMSGAIWYVPNGEIIRVGNSSQSWAEILLDIPLPPDTDVEEASAAILRAAEAVAQDDEWKSSIVGPPAIMGVAQMSIDVLSIRVGLQSTSEQQWAVQRELRRRISVELRAAGLSEKMGNNRVFVPRSTQEPQ
ncbi:mechanosensitive ion channel family protein [Natronoglycomyces albus]|uniref:Mechanosensitive ion channel family protein n=1 Tax=Natronoglycomyces albus TaxID=2811108 RepID=A0A895XVM1_9ACTN|nr:mechanosensitive ion channel family protein [Natronoglycomyces albus]QSB06270.1 mechanosensitive ion channel family protein [Natronoglycomyces albus]